MVPTPTWINSEKVTEEITLLPKIWDHKCYFTACCRGLFVLVINVNSTFTLSLIDDCFIVAF